MTARPIVGPDVYFPRRPAMEYLTTWVALAGLVALLVTVVVSLVRGDAVMAPVPPVEPAVVSADQFGPAGGGADVTRFYGPSDLLDDLRNVEISEADVEARLAELFGETVDNIGRPIAELAATGEGTP